MSTVSERELVGFASKRFREAGVTVSQGQMREIITATGYLNKESEYRLYDFVHDIEKLIALSEDGVLQSEDIGGAVNGDRETFIFDLIDGISENNKTRALEILYNRMSDDPYGGIPLTSSIISQMELMYCIKEYTTSMEGPSSAMAISKRLGVHEFRVKKAMRYCSRYSLQKLRDMLQASYRTHADIVTGLLEPRFALEMFIAQI
jgi:DNA polymerase-3 subunit delta